MDFTREPIVESVISPREGCKLVLRNSKSAGGEEYFVDAIEVVRFGSAIFFRSLERPKSFLLPVSDYEVLEVRETRVVLKHAVAGEKSDRQERRPQKKEKVARKEEPVPEEEAQKEEPKTKRRRQRRRRRGEETESPAAEERAESKPEAPAKPPVAGGASPSSLLPPPTALISESIGRYKEMMAAAQDEPSVEIKVVEEPLSMEPAEPALVPPGGEVEVDEEAAKSLGVFSAGRFLRRLAGQEKGEEEPAE